MGRRYDHTPDALRNLILDTAEAIVEKKGLQCLTARKIGTKIGYSVGTLYHSFKNLDDIKVHLSHRTLEALLETLETARRATTKPEEAPFTMGHAYLQFVRKHSNAWRTILESRLEEYPDWYLKTIQSILSCVKEGLRPSWKKSDSELDKMVVMTWAALQGLAVLSDYRKITLTSAYSESELLESFLKAIISS